MKPEIQRTLISIINGKGGVGKTLITAHLEEFLRFQQVRHLLFDCDSNRSLSRILPEAIPLKLTAPEDIETLLSKVIESDVTLSDTPAGLTDALTSLFATASFSDAFAAVDGRLVVVLPITSGDSVSETEARRLVAAVRTEASYVVVKNERGGNDWSAWDGSPTAKFLGKVGAVEATFPLIPARVQRILDGEQLTLPLLIGRFWNLRQCDPKAAFSQTALAQAAQRSLSFAFAAFSKVSSALFPDSVVVKPVDDSGLIRFCISRWSETQTR